MKIFKTEAGWFGEFNLNRQEEREAVDVLGCMVIPLAFTAKASREFVIEQISKIPGGYLID